MASTAEALSPAAALPLSLYVHFPWCVRKCPYCDFNSHRQRGEIPESEYVDALTRDLDHELSLSGAARPLVSIFLGGGTPSLFGDRAIGRLLDAVRQRLPLADGCEITLEANPGTVDAAHFRGYRSAGVNRLSIGVQSLNAAHLKALGRIHDPNDARRAVDTARATGFDNLNLDLMYALPRQTVAEAEADLAALCALAPEHVSYYQLTLEPNTAFAAQPPPLPEHDSAWTMHENGQALLAAQGYGQYETSAYAQGQRQSVHNRNYWTFGDYLGIGAGAHGKATGLGTGDWGLGHRVTRRARHKLPKTYLAAAGTAAALQEHIEVRAADLPFEYAMNALRLNEGFAYPVFESRTGLPRSVLAAPLAAAERLQLVELSAETVRPSERGRAHLNTLLQLFLPDA